MKTFHFNNFFFLCYTLNQRELLRRDDDNNNNNEQPRGKKVTWCLFCVAKTLIFYPSKKKEPKNLFNFNSLIWVLGTKNKKSKGWEQLFIFYASWWGKWSIFFSLLMKRFELKNRPRRLFSFFSEFTFELSKAFSPSEIMIFPHMLFLKYL